MAFDTLDYTKQLTSAGMPQAQAEVQARTLNKIIESDLATKRDLKEIEAVLRRDMKELETSLKHDMKDLETKMEMRFKEVDARFKELELRMTVRLGTMMVLSIGVVATLVKLL